MEKIATCHRYVENHLSYKEITLNIKKVVPVTLTAEEKNISKSRSKSNCVLYNLHRNQSIKKIEYK